MSHTLQNAMNEYIKFLQEKSKSTKILQQDLKTYLNQLTNEFVNNHFDLKEKESDGYIQIDKYYLNYINFGYNSFNPYLGIIYLFSLKR